MQTRNFSLYCERYRFSFNKLINLLKPKVSVMHQQGKPSTFHRTAWSLNSNPISSLKHINSVHRGWEFQIILLYLHHVSAQLHKLHYAVVKKLKNIHPQPIVKSDEVYCTNYRGSGFQHPRTHYNFLDVIPKLCKRGRMEAVMYCKRCHQFIYQQSDSGEQLSTILR
jgi:hypothetical protein